MTLACNILSCLFNFAKNKIYMIFQKTSSDGSVSHPPAGLHRLVSIKEGVSETMSATATIQIDYMIG